MTKKLQTLVICSGGLDSVTLAYDIARRDELHSLLSFDYGQRHKKELDFAKQCADDLGVAHRIIDISHIGRQLTSSLTSDIDVPEGHYTSENMAVTVVPNRNTIMLTIAFGLASSLDANAVALAVHGGDHFIYPDCRPEFIDAFAEMQKLALNGVSEIDLLAPFVHFSKAEIAKLAAEIDVPFEKTWSCYQGGELHCGRCGTCVERIEALATFDIPDPTDYMDTEFWKTAVEKVAHV